MDGIGIVQKLSLPRALVGESIRWHPQTPALFYVDIIGQQLRRFDPENGDYAFWDFDAPVGGWYPTTRDTVLLGVGLNVVEFDTAKGEIVGRLCTLPGDPQDLRVNEGRCDARGRLWLSTMSRMNIDQPAVGALYRVDVAGKVEQFLDGLTIPNTLCWSPDNRTMYLSDSLKRHVMAFDYDLQTGQATDRRILFSLDDSHVGIPDGAAMDVDGHLWIAMPRSARIERRAPDGTLDLTIPLPCLRPTMCAFGGLDTRGLYISSLSVHLSEAERKTNVEDGFVYFVHVPISGMAENSFDWKDG